jgi:hypothetical protein
LERLAAENIGPTRNGSKQQLPFLEGATSAGIT